MTRSAKLRMYELLRRNLADSFKVILTFFFLGASFLAPSLTPFETILS